MTAFQGIAIVVLAVMVVLGSWLLPRVWRGDFYELHERGSTAWWPAGEGLRRGFLRGLPLGIIQSGVLLLIILVLLLANQRTPFSDAILIGLGTIWFFVVALDVCVVLFNHPKWAVPRKYRSEPGALQSWIGRRRDSQTDASDRRC